MESGLELPIIKSAKKRVVGSGLAVGSEVIDLSVE